MSATPSSRPPIAARWAPPSPARGEGSGARFFARLAPLALLLLAACARHGPPAPLVSPVGASPVAAAPAPAPAPTTAPASRPDRVTVAGGETLYAIARRY